VIKWIFGKGKFLAAVSCRKDLRALRGIRKLPNPEVGGDTSLLASVEKKKLLL